LRLNASNDLLKVVECWLPLLVLGILLALQAKICKNLSIKASVDPAKAKLAALVINARPAHCN
jgi:hypothetical protein